MDEQTVSEIHANLLDLEKNFVDGNLIKDNSILFRHEEKLYKVSMPNQKEEFLAEEMKNLAYMAYISKEGFFVKKKLKEILKEKQDVDVDELELEIQSLADRRDELFLILAPKYSDSKRVHELQEEIEILNNTMKLKTMELSNYLSPCVESKAEAIYMEKLTALCTLVQNDENEWVLVWKSQEEFEKETSSFTSKAVANMTFLFLSTRI